MLHVLRTSLILPVRQSQRLDGDGAPELRNCGRQGTAARTLKHSVSDHAFSACTDRVLELAGGPLPAPRRRPHRRTGTAGVPVIPSLSAASSGLRFVLLGFLTADGEKLTIIKER